MTYALVLDALTLLMVGCMLATSIRVFFGPSLPDRVVALDLLAIEGIGLLMVFAVITRQRAYVDVAMVLALLAFLTTVAFALYIERRA